MLVCEECLQAMRSHGETLAPVVIVVDETDPNDSRCECCKENGNNALYDI